MAIQSELYMFCEHLYSHIAIYVLNGIWDTALLCGGPGVHIANSAKKRLKCLFKYTYNNILYFFGSL